MALCSFIFEPLGGVENSGFASDILQKWTFLGSYLAAVKMYDVFAIFQKTKSQECNNCFKSESSGAPQNEVFFNVHVPVWSPIGVVFSRTSQLILVFWPFFKNAEKLMKIFKIAKNGIHTCMRPK